MAYECMGLHPANTIILFLATVLVCFIWFLKLLYECIKFGYPIENVRFLLLSTNLAREWLQIDTDLLHIITSTAQGLFGGTNIDDTERP